MERNERTLFGEPVLAWAALAAGVIAVCGHSASAYSFPVLMKAITAGHDVAHTYAPMWRTFSLVLVAALVLPSALAALRPR